MKEDKEERENERKATGRGETGRVAAYPTIEFIEGYGSRTLAGGLRFIANKKHKCKMLSGRVCSLSTGPCTN